MFGRLTRERFEWHPDRVLCKRFNIANPYPESSLVGVPGGVKRDKFEAINFLDDSPAVEDEPETNAATEPAKGAALIQPWMQFLLLRMFSSVAQSCRVIISG